MRWQAFPPDQRRRRSGLALLLGLVLLPSAEAAGYDVDVWQRATPWGIGGMAAVYDPVGDRVIAHGGRCLDSAERVEGWALGLAGTAGWTRYLPGGELLPAASAHGAVVDAGRQRALFMVGLISELGVWEINLAGRARAARIVTAGTPPVGRRSYSAIFDPVRDRLLIFGGLDARNAIRGDLWELSFAVDPPTWRQIALPTLAPAPRYAHAGVYDPVRQRMILHGGQMATQIDVTTWALDLRDDRTWAGLVSVAPSRRLYASLIHDPVADRLILYGGSPATTPPTDTWTLDLAGGSRIWAQLDIDGAPPTRSRHGAVYDPVRRRMVVFGAAVSCRDPAGGRDAWALELDGAPAWRELPSIGAATPPARTEHAGARDILLGQLVVFGGLGEAGRLDDAWAISMDDAPDWAPIATEGTRPSPRSGHAAVWDPTGRRLLVVGGEDDAGLCGDVWALDLTEPPVWTRWHPIGDGPGPRRDLAAAWSARLGGLVLFGGHDGQARDDLWLLRPGEPPAWQRLEPPGERPAARYDHALVRDGEHEEIYLTGGADDATLFNDLWRLPTSPDAAWTRPAIAGTPPPLRCGTSATYDPCNHRLVLFGGGLADGVDDGGFWTVSLADIDPLLWWFDRCVSDPAAAPSPRRDAVAAFGGHIRNTSLWFFGGSAAGRPVDDLFVLRLNRPTPVQLAAVTVARDGPGVRLAWRLGDAFAHAGFHVWRSEPPGERSRLTAAPLLAGTDYSFLDPVAPAGEAAYWLEELATTGEASWFGPYALAPAPAPVEPALAIAGRATDGAIRVTFELARAGHVRLALFDLRGRLVATLLDEGRAAGRHEATWNGRDGGARRAASGVYFARLATADGVRTARVTLAR